MKAWLVLLLLFFFGSLDTAKSQDDNGVIVYVFLYEDCVISQHYTLVLKELHAEFASEQLQFRGVFPNSRTDDRDMLIFRSQYELPFEMVRDEDLSLTRRLGARVTPEVVVYDTRAEAVLYKGRIDDTYFRVGKKRRVTTSSELRDVLEAISNGIPITTENTEAIGCFIEGVR